jgi:cysteine desulfurase/selenocysteine lyase
MSFDPDAIRRDIPALQGRQRGKPVVYLDNACLTPKPEPVLRAMDRYYREFPGCHGRAAHSWGAETTAAYDAARASIATFIGASSPQQLVFTRNATEAVGIVAQGLGLEAGDRVLTSDMEHNSNLLPWVAMGKRVGVVLDRFATTAEGELDRDAYLAALARGPRLVSFFQRSNVTGVGFPVRWMVEQAKARGALVLVDASQATSSERLEVAASGADFVALSMHKAFGPTGTGVLYGRREALEALTPLLYGGEMIADVRYEEFSLAPVPQRFEAGLQNYAGCIGAGAAAEWLRAMDPAAVQRHLAALNQRATDALQGIRGLRIVGPVDPAARHGILNFAVEGVPSSHLAQVLDQSRNIMVRAGVHCVHSWYAARGLPPTVRASFALYNTLDEAELLGRSVRELAAFFR